MQERGTAFIITFFVFKVADGQPATGAASYLTPYISKDGGTPAATTNSIFEVSGSVQPGVYGLQLTATETDGNILTISFATSDITINAMPVICTTEANVPTAAQNAAAVDVSGALSTYGAAKTSDVTAQTATLMEVLQEVLAGLFNWGLSHDVLTIYKDGAATKTFQITRDSSGNITAISPIDESSSGEAE